MTQMIRKDKNDDSFDVSTTRCCDFCKIDVRISLGGEANWQQHVKSKVHQSNERKANPPPKKTYVILQQVNWVCGLGIRRHAVEAPAVFLSHDPYSSPASSSTATTLPQHRLA